MKYYLIIFTFFFFKCSSYKSAIKLTDVKEYFIIRAQGKSSSESKDNIREDAVYIWRDEKGECHAEVDGVKVANNLSCRLLDYIKHNHDSISLVSQKDYTLVSSGVNYYSIEYINFSDGVSLKIDNISMLDFKSYDNACFYQMYYLLSEQLFMLSFH